MNSRITIPGGSYQDDGHKYFDERGVRVPSVTQVFSLLGLIDYDRIKKEVLERKSAIGIAVHSAVEYLCEGTLDLTSLDPVVEPYVAGVQDWMSQMSFVSTIREQRGIHQINGMRYGYAFDHEGTMVYRGKQRHVILDLKTCVSQSPTWALQTAAYALTRPALPAFGQYLRVVLQVDGTGKVTPHYYENREDNNTFLYMLYCAIWKLNHQLESLEAA